MQKVNLADVQEAGIGNGGIKAGGYVCRYTNVSDDSNKQYLYMEFDIAEGEKKDYYKQLNEKHGFWGGKVYRSYKEAALPMFKRMCSAVSKSNPGFIFDGGEQNADESTLIGKMVGIILGEEEYEKNNGSVGTRTYVYAEVPVEIIKKGEFKIPDKKLLDKPAAPANNGFVNVPDGVVEELPFT